MDEVVPGIKAGVTVTSVGAIRTKDGSYRNECRYYQD